MADIYWLIIKTVSDSRPDPRGTRDQQPDPNKCNYTLKSETKGEVLTPDPNECNSVLRSVTKSIYPNPHFENLC